jgi:hypothetical protein
MRRPIMSLVVILSLTGAVLALGFFTASTLGVIVGGFMGGLVIGVVGNQQFGHVHRTKPAVREQDRIEPLMTILVDMGDALQATMPRALQQRGGWNQHLFDRVLAHIEQQAPAFQHALIAYLAQPAPLDTGCVTALLAVDRLSAAYTYWTRLFPPRQPDESMFVLSLLQDLSEKVEHAIARLDDQLA